MGAYALLPVGIFVFFHNYDMTITSTAFIPDGLSLRFILNKETQPIIGRAGAP